MFRPFCQLLSCLTLSGALLLTSQAGAQDWYEEDEDEEESDEEEADAEDTGQDPQDGSGDETGDGSGDSEGGGQGSGEAPIPSIEGRIRVGLELTLADFESVSMTVDDGTMTSYDRNVGSVGLTGGAGLGPVLGYGLSDSLLLSTSVLLSHSSASFGDVPAAKTTRFEVTPAIAYLFGAGESLRPFVGGVLGLRVRSGPVGATDVDEVSLLPGAQAGVHLFLNDAFSVDARVMLGYLFALSASSEGGFGPLDYASANGPVIMLLAGLSYWD